MKKPARSIKQDRQNKVLKGLARSLTRSPALLFFIAAILSAAQAEFHWGGPGYDPTLKKYKDYESSRYTARLHDKDLTLVDIMVDSEETASEVGQMNLINADKAIISSKTCWKSMRHITAPWTCSFSRSSLENLSGKGEIRTLNKWARTILKDTVDFDALKDFLK